MTTPSFFIQIQSQVHEACQLHYMQWFKDSKGAYYKLDMGTQTPSLELLHENVKIGWYGSLIPRLKASGMGISILVSDIVTTCIPITTSWK